MAIQVPHYNSIARFPTPTFNLSIASLSLSVVVLSALATVSPFCAHFFTRTSLGALVSIPITVGGTALGVRRLGLAQQWWKYEEVWLPHQPAHVALRLQRGVMRVEDDEKAVDMKALLPKAEQESEAERLEVHEGTAFLQV
jgi:hypothetical protein